MATTHVAQPGTKVVAKTALLITSIAAMLSIAWTAPVAAQTSPASISGRAQELAAERDGKARTLTSPQRSLIERGLNWYDNNGARLQWRFVHFTGGSFPQGAGLAYGIGIAEKAMGSAIVDESAPNRIDGAMFAARSIRGYQRVAGRMDIRNLGGRAFDAVLRWQDDTLPQEDFYGLGNNTSRDQRTNYRLDGNELTAGLKWRPTGRISIGGEISHLTPVIGAGTDRRYASTESRFTEADAPGMTDLPRFLRVNIGAGYDWRDSETHPRRGGNYKATLSRYGGVHDGAFDFRRLDAAAQQIVPLFSNYRRLELRAAVALTDAGTGARVPFIYQPTVGGLTSLRGFSEYRYRDQNAVWASAEYQWQAWWALDAALFVDAGQVAATRSSFRIREFDVTYGVGFRLHSTDRFLARLDLAHGREGFHPLLGFTYGF